MVCVGCCHAGLVNTLAHIRRLTGEQRVHAVIGGLHLHSATPQRLAETVTVLQRLSVESLIPCHCTGHKAVAALEASLGRKVVPGRAGATYRFE